MVRHRLAVGCALLVAVVSWVRAQDEPSGFPVGASANEELPRPALEPPAGWRAADDRPAGLPEGAEEEQDESLRPYRLTSNKGSTTGDSDGMQSVLKRRPAPIISSNRTSGSPAPPSSATAAPQSGRRTVTASPAAESERERVPQVASRPAPARVRSVRDGVAVAEEPGLLLEHQTPTLRLEASGPAAITVGKIATYRLAIVNDSQDSARDVTVTVGVPAGVTLEHVVASSGEAPAPAADSEPVQWRLASLAGGARETLELQVTPHEQRAIQFAVDWSLRAAAMTTPIQVQQPELMVQIDGPEEVVFGARQLYTITIFNPGTGAADNVSLDVATGGNGQAKQIGTIPAGGQHQVRMELVAREAGTLDIRATATGDGLRHEAVKQVLVRRAELALDVAGPGLKFAGATGTYRLRVENVGNAPASEVDISLKLPAGATYERGLQGAVETAGRLTWRLNELGAGQVREYEVEVIFGTPGLAQCELHAAAEGELASTAQCETQVEALADLKMSVDDPQGPVPLGEEVIYTVRIENRGSKAAQAVSVVGQFAQGVEPVRAEGAQAIFEDGQAIFDTIPRIEAGQVVTLKIVAKASQAGNHRVRAVLKCTDPETELVAEDMTRFFGEESQAAGRRTTSAR